MCPATDLPPSIAVRAVPAPAGAADTVTQPRPLISICVCTYRRPRQLEQLLQCLDRQATKGLFNFSIVVVDNDAQESARSVVELWARRSSVPIAYGVEPRQNIALARNASVADRRACGILR
jgi:succinoglycan biosynthesis protein ExoM